MEKLFKIFRVQRITITVFSLLIAIAVALGVITNHSFLRADGEEIYDNASVTFNEDTPFYIDEMANKTSLEEALVTLDESNYALRIECLEAEPCFNCTKYKARVLQTVKGDIDEAGNEIVVYQWVSFSKGDGETLSFVSPDFSMPLSVGGEYLVFADKRDYCEEYQSTLECNEYSIALRGPVPTAYILNDVQKDYIHTSSDKTFLSLKNKYYPCFSEESLANINNLSKRVIQHYLS